MRAQGQTHSNTMIQHIEAPRSTHVKTQTRSGFSIVYIFYQKQSIMRNHFHRTRAQKKTHTLQIESVADNRTYYITTLYIYIYYINEGHTRSHERAQNMRMHIYVHICECKQKNAKCVCHWKGFTLFWFSFFFGIYGNFRSLNIQVYIYIVQ